MVDIPFPAVQNMGTVANRRAAGKALRKDELVQKLRASYTLHLKGYFRKGGTAWPGD
jgi:hypothetical protein